MSNEMRKLWLRDQSLFELNEAMVCLTRAASLTKNKPSMPKGPAGLHARITRALKRLEIDYESIRAIPITREEKATAGAKRLARKGRRGGKHDAYKGD